MNEGDLVDEFELLDQAGQKVSLAGLVEVGPLVLFFYPKAMTPG
jgi:peroxiredoxin Q/BCP